MIVKFHIVKNDNRKKKTLGDPWGTKGIHACVKGGTRGKAFSHFVADASQSPSVLPALVQCPCELAPNTQTVSSALPVPAATHG